MADELKITISAQDNASQVFKKIATEAGKVADNLEKAGKDGGKGFDQLGKSADKASASLMQISSSGSGVIRSLNDGSTAAERFGNNLLQLGTGLQSVGTALDGLGQSSINQQRQIMALNQLYGESSQQFQDFAKSVQNTTIFSDDQVRQAEIYFGTLKNNYDITDEQIKQLVQVSADLATIHGVSLEDAAMRIQSAVRGEAEAAEYLGLTLNQQSIDRENLTLTMSNQEAAQFRLNALWQQTANVTGASTQYVQTANGQWQQFKNTMQDVGQNVGGVVGPIGDVLATMGRGLATVGDAARGFTEISTVVRNSQLAMSALALAANPVTLALGAIAAAAVAGVAAWEIYNSSLDGVKGKFEDLGHAQQDAILNGDSARAAAIQRAIDDLHKMEQAINDALTIGPNGPSIPVPSDGMYEQVIGSITKALQDSRVDVESYMAWLESEFQKIAENPAIAGDVFNEIIDVSANSLGQFAKSADQTAASAQKAASAVDLLKEAIKGVAESAAKTLTDGAQNQSWGDRFLQSLGLDFGQSEKVKGVWESITANWGKPPDAAASRDEWLAYVRASGPNSEVRAEREKQYKDWLETQKNLSDEEAQARQAEEDARHQYNVKAAEARQQDYEDRKAAWEEEKAQRQQEIEERRQLAQQWIASGLELMGADNPLDRINLAGVGTQYSQLAGDINNANTALADGYRIVVQNTDAIAQQAQGVQDWADELIGAQGEYAKIDDLLAAGTITLTEYNAAQQAQVDIAAANASIQQDVLTIQAKQAPVLADLVEGQQDYIETLSTLPPMQQAVALGWMDANEAAKANQAITMAAAAANGELGAKGKEATTAMIQGAVAADPYLKAMLLDMGLISEGVDGTITVNFDQAEGANKALEELTKSIDALTLALGGVPPLHIDTNAEYAKSQIDAVRDSLNGPDGLGGGADEVNRKLQELAGQHVAPKIDADISDAEQAVTAVSDLLAPLDGKTIETRVRVLLDDETGGGAGSGLGSRIGSIASRFGEGGVKIPVSYDAPPPLDLPDPDPVKVPVEYDMSRFDAQGAPSLPGSDNDITITVTADVSEAVIGLYNLQTQADTLNSTTVTIPVSISMDNSVDFPSWLAPYMPMDNPTGGAASFDPITMTVTLEAQDNASGPVKTVRDAIEAIPDSHTTTISEVGSGAVIGLASAVTNTINAIPTEHSTTISLIGAEAAIGLASAVANTINAIPDSKSSVINVVTAYSTTGTPPKATEHGGLLHYANGGLIPHIAGEGNRPEIAHYANGGMAVLPYEGLYANPPGTYISPAPANPGAGGGVVIQFTGNFYGSNRAELNEWAANDLLPAIKETVGTHRRQFGGA